MDQAQDDYWCIKVDIIEISYKTNIANDVSC